MSNGNVAVPLDIQLNITSLSDCINRADFDKHEPDEVCLNQDMMKLGAHLQLFQLVF